MKKLGIALLVLVALSALAVFALPLLIPQSLLEERLGPALQRSTGLQLQQAKRLRLSILPEPAIAIEDISAVLPAANRSAPLLRADRIAGTIRLSSLFDGRVELQTIILENPVLEISADTLRASLAPADRPALQKAAAGQAEARFIPAANVFQTGRSMAPMDVAIKNGSVVLVDGDVEQTVLVSHAGLNLATRGSAEPVEMNGDFRLLDEPVTVSAVATPSEAGADTQIVLESQAGRTVLDGALVFDGETYFSGRMQTDIASADALARMSGGVISALSRLDDASIAGQIRVSGKQIRLSEGLIKTADMQSELSLEANYRGPVRVDLDRLEMYGGQGQGTFTLERGKDGSVLGGTLDLSGADALALGRNLWEFDWLSGRADTQIRIAAGGKSPQDLLATMQGDASLTITDGAIEGLDLPAVVADARDGQFNDLDRREGKRTRFDRLSATYEIEDGVASTDDLSLSGPDIEASGQGRTNFLKQRVNYRLNTKVSAPEPAGGQSGEDGQERAVFTVPLVIKGDWKKPEIYPDIEGALDDPESLRGTAKLFGKSVEKLTDGEVKADDFGRMIDGLFGNKKKAEPEAED